MMKPTLTKVMEEKEEKELMTRVRSKSGGRVRTSSIVRMSNIRVRLVVRVLEEC